MRAILLATAIVAAGFSISAPAFAAEAAAVAKPAYSTAETTIGELVANAETKAVFDKHLPGVSSNEQFEMAKSMTLRQVQSYAPDMFSDETLAKMDADLAKVPTKK